MNGYSMGQILNKLIALGIDIKSLRGLDFFAREGDWQTIAYASEIGSLDAWEIDPDFAKQLKKNIPNATVRVVNSFEYGKECSDVFDFIVIDNPQNVFGPKNEYCEHFEALPIAANILADVGFLIFNVNWAPFNYAASPLWRLRREEFYGTGSTEFLSLNDFILPFYTDYMEELGFQVHDAWVEPRNDYYLTNLILHLRKKT